MTLLCGGKVALEGELKSGLAVLFGEKILKIAPEKDLAGADAERVFYSGTLLPGFIDIHLHGAAGADVMDAQEASLSLLARTVVRSGTTSFLAATMTAEEHRILRALETVRSYLSKPQEGAQCLGVHLEGPFLNPAFAGAQDARWIQAPTLRWLLPFLDVVKVITLAPEMDEGMRFIREMKDRAVLSIGHSGADYETAVQSFEAGIRHVTHCGNGMSGLHHRSPGVVGAALTCDVSLDMIADLLHVHPAFLKLAAETKGPDRFLPITDSIAPAYLEDGVYDLGGRRAVKQGPAVRLEGGALAGSVHRLDEALRNLLEETRFELPDVSKMLSLAPAKLLKIDHCKGKIQEGYDADLAVLEGTAVTDVYVGGKRQ